MKKIVIGVLIVLMLLCCINSCSANDSVNQTLGAEGEIMINDAPNEVLSDNDVDEMQGADLNPYCTVSDNDQNQVLVENDDAVFVNMAGNDFNNGSANSPVATIKKAVEIASGENGIDRVIIGEGTYIENNIELSTDKAISIIGQGNVVIDGNASSNSIFIMHGGEATFVNLKFTNNNPKYGGAIFMNYGSGTSRTIIEVNVVVDHCSFENLSATSRGGAIYAWYTKGNLLIMDSNFCNIDTGSWGAVCAGYSTMEGGLNLEIYDSNFDNNTANNGAAAYLQASEITIYGSNFTNNHAVADSGAVYLYNTTASIDDCIISNNTGESKGAAIKLTTPSKASVSTLTITNSIIENNSGRNATSPAIYADLSTVNVRYSSLINNLSVETRTGQGYDAVYGQGVAFASNNWWGTNDPKTKVSGSNITIDSWLIMNVVANASEVVEGDNVKIDIDFNHVNTTSGQIEELTGGVIPKDDFKVSLTAENGTVVPEELTISRGEVKEAIFTAYSGNSRISIYCEDAVENITYFIPEENTYFGPIYVSKDGSDSNEGSEEYPVASIEKAIELAYVDGGSCEIIVNEGTYTGNGYHITKNLTVTGVGEVILDANGQGRLFTMSYGDNAGKLELNNLILTGAYNDYGAAIYSFADELILNNITVVNNPGPGSLIKNYGKITINNSEISNFVGGNVIDCAGNGDITINNTLFENNIVLDDDTSNYGIVYISSGTGTLTIENSKFINNTARQSIVTVDSQNYDITVRNTEFINNTNTIAYGGAIRANNKLNISNSTFINNAALKEGGAVYVGLNSDATITQSVFINNSAGESFDGDAIYVSGKLDISDSIIIAADDSHYALASNGATVSAENNWWGTNKRANTNAEVNKIVTLTAAFTPNDAQAGDEITITATFDNVNLPKGIPDVAFKSSSGKLNEIVPVTDSQASINYTIDSDDYSLTVSSSNAKVFLPLKDESGIIFVLPGASDSNPGTRDAPVGTIAKALELSSGQIVLLEGTHKTSYLDTISDDLNITGEGRVVIDADNNNRILYVGEDAEIVIRNVIMVNGYSADGSGGLLGNSNKLTLINCTLANSSASDNNGGAIYNVGKLTIINSTIANNSAKEGGAIFTNDALAVGASIKLINSSFINNYASGNDNLGGGAIFTQQITEFTMENVSFIDNKVGTTASGGAIFISHSSAAISIKDSRFIANHANGQNMVGGGAIYRAASSNYVREGTLTISNTLFENNTCDANGGAIYVRATTLTVANSVLINNTDSNGLAIYGYVVSGSGPTLTPTITLNDNWWGTNDSPKNLVGSNTNYKPTLNRWAVLTITNDSEIIAGNTVKLTVDINNYTTGSVNGTLSKPIGVPRQATIKTTYGDITGTLVNGEFTYDYLVPDNLYYIAATVDGETQVLYVVSSSITVSVDDISAKKYDKVNVVINVTSSGEVNSGFVELYADNDLMGSILVNHSQAIGDIVISKDIGTYTLTARYIDSSGLFDSNESNAILTVDGICELWNDTFFNFFDDEGKLRDEIDEEELVFHGDFSGLGVKVITIPVGIQIVGENAKLYDMSFALRADDIKLSNVTLIVDNVAFSENSGAAIFVTGNDVELDGIVVNYTTPRAVDAFAIFASSAYDFKLTNSAIIFDSNNDDESIVNQFALRLDDSTNFIVKDNAINTYLPARDVAYNYYYPERTGIIQDLVLAIGIQNGEAGNLTSNVIDVVTKSAVGYFPTIDTIMVDGVSDLEISYNNITHIDSVNAGNAGYSNAIDLYNFNGIDVKYNNVLINSTAGIEAKGTAYPVQATGPYNGLVVDSNNLTSVSKGPALGIYSQNFEGGTDIVITNNNIDVTGLATTDAYALVSGMELQDTSAKVYNNTVHSTSIGSYDDANALYGISYAQETDHSHTFDIRDNTVYTDGKYAVYLYEAVNSNVTYNELYAHELSGDSSVYIGGNGNIILNNTPNNKVTIEARANKTKANDNSTIDVTLSPNDAGGIVSITIDDVQYSANVSNGSATIYLPRLPVGEYSFEVVYSGDAGYEGASVDVAFNVSKATPILTVTPSAESYKYGADAKLTINLNDENGILLDGIVVVNVDDVDYDVNVTNGIGDLTVSGLETGSYVVNATFGGDDIYESISNCDANIVINKSKAVTANVSVADVIYGNPASLVITGLSDVDGKLLSVYGGYQLVGPVNPYGSFFVKKGSATVQLNGLPAGNYSIYVVFGNNVGGDYEFENYIVDFNVLKATADLDIHVIGNNTSVGYDKSITTYVDVFNATGKVQYFEGESQIGEDKNVNETLDLSNLAEGMHIITVKYVNDNNYDADDKVIEFIVSSPKEGIIVSAKGHTTRVDKNATVDVTLSEQDATGTVTISIDGTDYSAIVDNGAATISLPILPAGQYTFDVAYSGDAIYESNSTSVTFNVNKYYAHIKASARTVKVGDDVTVNVVLEDDATGSVAIEVNGVNYMVDIENGVATIVIPELEAGEYTLDVTYSGDDKYKPYPAQVKFNVNMYKVRMKASARTVHIGDDVTVNVVLSDDATGNVSIIANGNEFTGTVENGVATVVLTGLPADQYVLDVAYSGDGKYKAYTGQVTFNVNKFNSAMTSTARTVKVGDNVTVNVALSEDATGNVFIAINGTNYTASVENGVASIVIPELPAGQYALDVTYSGDDKYKAKTSTVTFNVNKYNVRMKATARTVKVGNDVTVNVALSDDATGSVGIDVNGTVYTSEVVSGTASVILPNLPVDNYVLNVDYSGDDKYKAYTTTVKFNVNA